MTDVVIGLYSGYEKIKTPKGGIYYFLKTLRAVNKTCKIFILCEKEHQFEELVQLCNKTGTTLYDDFSVPELYGFEKAPVMQRHRFIIIHDILKKINTDSPINQVLVTDVNDVIFQRDPFQILYQENALYCATEINVLSDGDNSSSVLNMEWIYEYSNYKNLNDYGVALINTENFREKRVVCVGTIVGAYDSMLLFLDFYKKINSNIYVFLNDQAALNIYVYNHGQSSIMTTPLEVSKILTLDKIQFENISRDKSGLLVNKNNDQYAIVHQIDRCNFEYMVNLAEYIITGDYLKTRGTR
jgi:hypothetical protein